MLPKNTYQQLPVTEGQIPVSSTNSVLLLLCPLKNREEEKKKEKGKSFFYRCYSKRLLLALSSLVSAGSLGLKTSEHLKLGSHWPLHQSHSPQNSINPLEISLVSTSQALRELSKVLAPRGAGAMYSRFVLCIQETLSAQGTAGSYLTCRKAQDRCSNLGEKQFWFAWAELCRQSGSTSSQLHECRVWVSVWEMDARLLIHLEN